MQTDHPLPSHIPQLRKLWQEVFGDTDVFLDSFFQTGFSPDRCLCIFSGNRIAAALYWLDCETRGQKQAYIYAVATHPDFRNQGLCRHLMSRTHDLLALRGYASALLVPQTESLRAMYKKMGYRNAGAIGEFSCQAGEPAAVLRSVGPEEFARLRRKMLPEGSVLQEGHSLSFLAAQAQFYAGKDFLLTGYAADDVFHGFELLGNRDAAPGIVRSLGCSRGSFRTPEGEESFAMFLPLREDAYCPLYFGFAFD